MPYSEDELRTRLKLGEDSGWEFKEVDFRGDGPVARQRANWAEEIVAFANANGGVLLFGVTDNGDLTGMNRPQMDAVERMVSEVCRDSIAPPLDSQIYRHELDGLPFLLVDVPIGYALHEYGGQSYIRVGSAKRLMTSDQRLRLAQRRGQARYRGVDEQTVAETGFATLSEQLWKPLLSAESMSDPLVGLEKLGLLAEDDQGQMRATIAGLLLCSEAPEHHLPHAQIVAVRYRGEDPGTGQIDAQEIRGPINRQITEALAFASRNMRVGARKRPAREDMPEYSLRAIFEALVNAVAHRDYSIRGSRIRLRVFSNRLELCSPGSLPNSLTIESMGERQSTRNEVLSSILGRMRTGAAADASERQFFMERRGDGVPIIRRETMKLTGKEPQYRLLDDSELCLTIPAAEPDSGPANVVVTVRMNGRPFEGADVLALFPNRTWKRAATNLEGEARLDLHSVNLPMTVFAAADGIAAHVERDWIPAERGLAIEVNALPNGGSVVFAESTGHIPGLTGRLNPILDTSNRTYLYATNIAINGGQQQPVTFAPEAEELHLVDADGKERFVRIIAVSGRSSLLEYKEASTRTPTG